MADTMFSLRLDAGLQAALQAEANRRGETMSAVARAGLQRAYATDRAVYGPGSGASFVRDSWAALTGTDADGDTRGRIDRFRAQLADGTALAAFSLGTPDLPQANPPAYQPLSVQAGDTDRPLWALTTVQPIGSSSPFTIPAVATSSGTTAAHVEDVQPSAGSVAFAGATIAPRGFSGLFDVSRELLDSSNPAIDTVVLGAMLEDWDAQLEGVVADELATLTPADTTAAGTIAADVAEQISLMVGTRRRRASAAAVTAAPTIAAALSAALDERSGDTAAEWRVQGVGVNLSADLGAAATGELIAAITSPQSLWAWTTGARTFRFEQVSGPAVIRLALHGYAACRAVRPAGIRTLTHS